MSIRRQDVSALLFHYLGYSGVRNIILRLQKRPVARLICFHDVMPAHAKPFQAKLRFLKERTNAVSLDDFFSGRLSAEKINVVITFDDGYKSWVSIAVPMLRDLELPAAFFISSGFIGLSKDDEARFVASNLFPEPYRSMLFPGLGGPPPISGGLSLDDVMRLTEQGFTVGGHTLNHCNLSELLDPDQIRYEISEDKLKLEKITGREIKYFAYPSGGFQNPEINLVEMLIEAGYVGAVTTQAGFNYLGSNPYLLNRELTRACMPLQVFRARVYGNHDAVEFLKRLSALC